jgi:hypothetical protein
MTEIVPTESPREVARYFQESGLFPDLRSEAQAFVKIVAGREMGLGPLAAVSGLNVIKGRVTFSANLLASMVKRHPVYDYRVTDHTDEACRIAFLQNREEIGVSEFTVADAKRAGLGGMNWQKYPKAMLFARALTQGVRWYCPDVTSGTTAYVPEEVGDQVEEVIEPTEVVEPPSRLDYLGSLVDDYELTEEEREALRDFIRDGGEDAVESAIDLLENGNLAALLAGIEFEAANG